MQDGGNIELILTGYNKWGDNSSRDEYIDKLEGIIEECNQSTRDGNPIVDDSVYDTLVEYLRELKPDSYLLHEVWSADDSSVPFEADLDAGLITHPMLSIQTIKHVSDTHVTDFKNRMPDGEVEVITSAKLNGWGTRIVYNGSSLVKGNTRGRSTNGRDVTRHMKLILGETCEEFDGLGIIELRAEVALPFHRLEKARSFNPAIKNAFTGVASMIRESASIGEILTLDVIVYDVIGEGLEFDTLAEKYEFLSECGFKTPLYTTKYINKRTLVSEIENILVEMDMEMMEYPYFTDGIVLSINDLELFSDFGAEEKYRFGNMALKMGRWKQDAYAGIIKEISWEAGKTKLTPVAVLQEGVLTASGSTVTNIPLYAPKYILMLEAYPNNIINFRFGGESGVIPITPDGRLVTDK